MKGVKGKRKGMPKTGGRKKGSLNKLTVKQKELSALIHDFNIENFSEFWEAWKECSPYEKCRVYLSALEYDLAKLQKTVVEKGESFKTDQVTVVGFQNDENPTVIIKNPSREYTQKDYEILKKDFGKNDKN